MKFFMLMRIFAIVAMIASLLLPFDATPTQIVEATTWPGYAGRLLFGQSYAPPGETYRYNIQSEGHEVITMENSPAGPIAESYDGSHTAYSSSDLGQREMYVVDTVSDQEIQITDSTDYEWGYYWSPIANKLAYISCNDNWDACGLYVYDADTSSTELVLDSMLIDGASWSPDGLYFLLTIYADDTWNEWNQFTIPSSGGSLVQITTDNASGYGSWSGDGSKVVYTTSADGDSEIAVVDADGSNQVTLTSNSGADSSPYFLPGDTIVFQSNRDGDYEIFTMDVGGGSVTQLTTNTSIDRYPNPSPDGSVILFSSNRDGQDELYTMSTSGGLQTRITNTTSYKYYTQWSHNGEGIYYQLNQPSRQRLITTNSSGEELVDLSNHANAYNDSRARWSPDGNKIGFHSTRDGNNEVYIMDADGGNQIRITDDAGSDTFEDWSPDGNKILFYSTRLNGGRLWVANADGSDPQCITCDLPFGGHYNASWSPQGDRIAVQSNGDGRGIFLVDPDGGDFVQLTVQVGTDWIDKSPVWSPDGSKIVFYSTRNGPNQEFIMDADGSNLQQLSDTTGYDGPIKFSPDGKMLSFVHYGVDPYGNYTMNLDGSNRQLLIASNPSLGEFYGWQPRINQAPVTQNDSAVIPYNTSKAIDVLTNDSDEESLPGDNLTIKIAPINGIVTVVDGKVKYTPNDGFKGSDQLTYQICDAFVMDQKCATGVLNITVQAPGAPALIVKKVSGSEFNSSTQKYETSSKRPIFSGTASPNAAIKVEIHSDPIVLTTTADGEGNWSVAPSENLPTGEHTVYITATLDGVTTELDSFVLAITDEAEIPNTGASALPIRVGGASLLLVGTGLMYWQRQKLRQQINYKVPSLW